MDIYTVFAMVMILAGGAGLTVGVLAMLDARQQIGAMREASAQWCGNILDQATESTAIRQKIERALAERVRNLETYRVNHAHRLNQVEDLVDLLNGDAGRAPAVDVVDPGVSPIDMQITDAFCVADPDEALRSRSAQPQIFVATDMPELALDAQAIVERRWLHGL